MRAPLDPFSEVVDGNRHWNPEWYSWLTELVSSISGSGPGPSPSTFPIEILAADRTYFVRPDGSDSNNGKANTALGAFATIQHAVHVALFLIMKNNLVTIKVADGTYDESADGVRVFGPYISQAFAVDKGFIKLVGNIDNPENVVINSGVFNSLYISGCYAEAYGFSVGSSVRDGLASVSGATFGWGRMHFRNARFHCRADYASRMFINGTTYTIAGNCTGAHYYAKNSSTLEVSDSTATIDGVLTMPNFAQADDAKLDAVGMSFVGSIIGQEYFSTRNGVIDTHGGGPLSDGNGYFPGSLPGVVGTGADWGVIL